jgi:hypothetical protein
MASARSARRAGGRDRAGRPAERGGEQQQAKATRIMLKRARRTPIGKAFLATVSFRDPGMSSSELLATEERQHAREKRSSSMR